MFLSAFYFPGEDAEFDFRLSLKTTYDQSVYPYGVLPKIGLNEIFFRPITILYGGNGSGKSTVLNVIAEKLRLLRTSAYNRSRFFESFVDQCKASLDEAVPMNSRILTSDDVFDMMLDIRAVNRGIDRKREELVDDYYALKREKFQVKSLDDFEHLHRVNQARNNAARVPRSGTSAPRIPRNSKARTSSRPCRAISNAFPASGNATPNPPPGRRGNR